MGDTIGIDLGTTNSAMAIVEDGEPEIIENSEGDRTTPSVVRIEEDEVVVGEPAARLELANPDTTVSRVKQHMDDQDYGIGPIHGEEYTPPQISSRILEKLKKDAEDRLESEVENAVVTVPAYFGNYAREATKDAGEMIDLNIEHVLNEPTAACLKYGFDKETEETILVYDLGGGTFDATLVELSIGKGADSVKVQGTHGDRQLGGEEIDDVIYEHLREEIIEQGFTNPDEEEALEIEVRRTAKQAKEDLSSQSSIEIIERMEGDIFETELTREEFNEMIEGFVDRTFDLINELFEHDEVEYSADDVDTVLLVGGSTRIPLIHERVEEYFGVEPSLGENPDEVVAEGAAIQAANLVGLSSEGEEEGTEMEGLEGNIITRDVISHTLGIELHDGSMSRIVDKNTEIPHEEQREGYTTVRDNQTTVEIRIFEGEDETAENNNHLGEFELTGIPPQSAGEPEFRVTFEVDENGILTAEVEDMDGELSESVTLDSTIGLDAEEIEKGRETMPQYKGE